MTKANDLRAKRSREKKTQANSGSGFQRSPQSRRHAEPENDSVRATRLTGFATAKYGLSKKHTRRLRQPRSEEHTKSGRAKSRQVTQSRKWCGWMLIIDNPYDRHARWRLFGVTALSRGGFSPAPKFQVSGWRMF